MFKKIHKIGSDPFGQFPCPRNRLASECARCPFSSVPNSAGVSSKNPPKTPFLPATLGALAPGALYLASRLPLPWTRAGCRSEAKMSYAVFKMMHWATGIENCASGYITHSPSDFAVHIPPAPADDLEGDLPAARRVGPIPNLVVTAGNILEVYLVRVQEEDGRPPRPPGHARQGGVVEGIAGARLELVCHYRLHGNVESMAILSVGSDNHSKRRDSIILAFQDAKISVMEYSDAIHGLRTSSMHCFEGPEWNYLKRGRESFANGPIVKADPQGRCGGALVYDLQMVILKSAQAGQGFVGDDDVTSSGGPISVCFESSYIINLRELDIKHVKDFTFVHGYIEPVLVILHERELTWAGRISWKHHTCMLSAFSISTTLKQHPLIWSAANLPHDAYKLLAVPSPIGGVLVVCANSIHYHSQIYLEQILVWSLMQPMQHGYHMMLPCFQPRLECCSCLHYFMMEGKLLACMKRHCWDHYMLFASPPLLNRLDLSKSKASVLTSDNHYVFGERALQQLAILFSSWVVVWVTAFLYSIVVGHQLQAPSMEKMRFLLQNLYLLHVYALLKHIIQMTLIPLISFLLSC
ncbi:hypothetical protein Taro_034944 [Colocasia esculenta]|uniref:RSE1/DDB1/CPSF1 first beta-propeller domain-containing protein n=1 Tax=Colocasia esculenta TaxID=4460 RepID=A0A843W4C3_COLES|nr:hypothetical protein [Colocasia esculenta]